MNEMSEITRRPTRTGTAMALSAGGLATLALAFSTTTAGFGGLVGTVVLAAGLARGSRRILDVAGGVFFLALIFGGVGGVGVEALLLGAVASILAWDVGENALSVGDHLGRETDTTRLEVVHAATTLLVLTVGVGVVYALWVVASGGQPIAAVVLLLVGVIALVAWVRR
ncbi:MULTISPECIES: hypothetical protein [Haloferax]|uniref:Uncharacterized protein n=2 Tax=Haloferax TaxID=2251 RepID=A0A6G1YYJ4_9EURY|nr:MULTISPECIES: hypothetical protein [Haloferax]KAB1186597.1 hypothetical protein Hfx1149_00510 [Haloferax sp. CBA1149]MRW79211.1 hypothetical protein [Haloferax marinisediminis]